MTQQRHQQASPQYSMSQSAPSSIGLSLNTAPVQMVPMPSGAPITLPRSMQQSTSSTAAHMMHPTQHLFNVDTLRAQEMIFLAMFIFFRKTLVIAFILIKIKLKKLE